MDIIVIPYPQVEQYSSHYAEEAGVPEYPLEDEAIHLIIKARIDKLSEDNVSELDETFKSIDLHDDLEQAYDRVIVNPNPLVVIKEMENKKYALSIVGGEEDDRHMYLTNLLHQSEITNRPIILPEISKVLTTLEENI